MSLFDRTLPRTRRSNPSRAFAPGYHRSTKNDPCLVFVDGVPLVLYGDKSVPAEIIDKKFLNGQNLYLVVSAEDLRWMSLCGKHATQLASNPRWNPDTTAPHLDPIPARTVPTNTTLDIPVPEGCCVDTDAMLILCPDTNNPWHGAKVTNVETISDNGLVTLTFTDASGATTSTRLPLCQMPGDGGECCYDAVNGVIVCDDPTNPMNGKKANLVDDLGNGYVYVCGYLDPAGSAITCARMPLCPDTPPVGCCYDAVQGIIVCENGLPPNGLSPEVVKQGTDANGEPYVVLLHPDLNNGNRTVMPLCPEAPPLECCFDAATGQLRCPGNATFDGLEVSLEYMTDVMPDGKLHAMVSHPNLPGGKMHFPLCDDEVPGGCCYDGVQKILVCPGNPDLDGKSAGVVAQFVGPDGKPWVSVAWDGGGARMPLCGTECPPSYCCVNLQTKLFVCPGEGALNNQPADIVNIETDGYGYNFAVLSDGTRVPVCGAECPPPELCPTCPTCPPGMWMTPDKECVLPADVPGGGECPVCPQFPPGECPKCPDGGGGGGYVPPDGGDCPWAPCCDTDCEEEPKWGGPDPAWWHQEGHCCESCALGLDCAGDCGCGEGAKESNPGVCSVKQANPGIKGKCAFVSSGGVYYHCCTHAEGQTGIWAPNCVQVSAPIPAQRGRRSNPPPELPIGTPCTAGDLKKGCVQMDKGCWCPVPASKAGPGTLVWYPTRRPAAGAWVSNNVLYTRSGKYRVKVFQRRTVGGVPYVAIRAVRRGRR